MNGKLWIVTGIFFAAVATALGAFGAHGLTAWLNDLNLEPAEYTKRLDNWKTGAMYQFYHSLALIFIGIVATMNRRRNHTWFNIAAICMVVGIVLFSGLLYFITLYQWRVGMIVPLGGVAFLVGWVSFAIAVFRSDLIDQSR